MYHSSGSSTILTIYIHQASRLFPIDQFHNSHVYPFTAIKFKHRQIVFHIFLTYLPQTINENVHFYFLIVKRDQQFLRMF